MNTSMSDIVALADWRRTISELYVSIRASDDPESGWGLWCETRRRLFLSHRQSPIPEGERDRYSGPFVFPYDPGARVLATLDPLDAAAVNIDTSDGRDARMVRFARARFDLFGHPAALDVFWLDQYGGGIYLAFRDATSGDLTYGGGRYLLDSVKGADFGMRAGRLVLDFNFAYQPSCSYDPRWSCPLPPKENTLPIEVEAGERLARP
jgi:uncharacterized protein (DUF1684 family)